MFFSLFILFLLFSCIFSSLVHSRALGHILLYSFRLFSFSSLSVCRTIKEDSSSRTHFFSFLWWCRIFLVWYVRCSNKAWRKYQRLYASRYPSLDNHQKKSACAKFFKSVSVIYYTIYLLAIYWSWRWFVGHNSYLLEWAKLKQIKYILWCL